MVSSGFPCLPKCASVFSGCLLWLSLGRQRGFLWVLFQWRETEQRTIELIFWGLELYFFPYPQESACPLIPFLVLSVNPLWAHLSKPVWVPCFRLSSAYCRTNVCIFLLHGSFHWHIPRPSKELAGGGPVHPGQCVPSCLLTNLKASLGWMSIS